MAAASSNIVHGSVLQQMSTFSLGSSSSDLPRISQAEETLKPYAGQSMTVEKIREVLQKLSEIFPTVAPSVRERAVKIEQKFVELLSFNLRQMQATLQEERPIYFPHDLVNMLSSIACSHVRISAFEQQGGFGTLTFMHVADQKYVVKSPIKGKEKVHNREVSHLLSLSPHPNVIGFYGILPLPDQPPQIVLEYAPDGDLYSLLERQKWLTPSEIGTLILQIMRAIKHLHDHRIIHRDVKPENAVLRKHPQCPEYPEGLQVQLIDFGLSFSHPPGTDLLTTKIEGSPHIFPPEYFFPKGKNSENKALFLISPKTDVWALGCLMFTMLSSDYHLYHALARRLKPDPFSGLRATQDTDKLYKAALKTLSAPNLQERINTVIKKLVGRASIAPPREVYAPFMQDCFQVDPDERSSIDALVNKFSALLAPQEPPK